MPMTTIRPSVCERLDVRREVRRADELEDDVERPVLLEALRFEHLVGAEPGDRVARVGVAHGRRDVRAEQVAELHGRRADAAGRAVHEQALARPQPGAREDRVVRGREDLGQPAGVGEADGVGHRHELALVDDRELGLAAAAGDAHDAVADREACGAVAERLDLAGELEAGDVLRAAGRRRVATAALEHVGAVDARRAHADEHLAGARLGIGMLLDENLAVADRGGTHWSPSLEIDRGDQGSRRRRVPRPVSSLGCRRPRRPTG